MIVVADSGPLHYLILLEHIDFLRRFYGHVVVPEPVAGELSAAAAPARRARLDDEAAELGGCTSGAV
jgi:predicted nucleic acid-binding protein